MKHSGYLTGLIFFLIGGTEPAVGSLALSTYPVSAVNGHNFTLMCTSTYNMTNVNWMIGKFDAFTSSGVPCTKQGEYNDNIFMLKDRIYVSCNVNQHNVTLEINSNDHGRVWSCRSGMDTSNSRTIYVQTDTATTSTNVQRTSSIVTPGKHTSHVSEPLSDSFSTTHAGTYVQTDTATTSTNVQRTSSIVTPGKHTSHVSEPHSDSFSTTHAETSETDSHDSQERPNVYMIVGIAAGVVVLLILLITVIVLCVKKGGESDSERVTENNVLYEESDNGRSVTGIQYGTPVQDNYAVVMKPGPSSLQSSTENVGDIYAKPQKQIDEIPEADDFD